MAEPGVVHPVLRVFLDVDAPFFCQPCLFCKNPFLARFPRFLLGKTGGLAQRQAMEQQTVSVAKAGGGGPVSHKIGCLLKRCENKGFS